MGLPPKGDLVGPVAGGLEQAGARQIFFHAVWSPPSKQLPWEVKRKAETAISFSLLGVSHPWVTASALVGGTGSHQPTWRIVSFFLWFSPF